MTARVRVQACGCIALPEELSRALGIGPGSMLQIQVLGDDRLEVVRTSDALASEENKPTTSCPIS